MELDSTGTPWYTDENEPYVGTLDPKTGQFTEYRLDKVAGVTDEILSLRDLVVDRDDNLWFPLRTTQGDVLVKYDVKTRQVTPVPNFRSSQFITTGDGNIWNAQGNGFTRINPKTLAVEARFDWSKAPNKPEDFCCTYQGVVDAKGNAYMGGNNYVVAVDGKTGAMRFVPIPTKFALPRRGRADTQGRYWFPEYLGDRLGMFDSRTDEVQEWPLRKYTTPYATSVPDRKGYVYASSNMSERVIRLDPKTGDIVEYLMPTQFDSKKIAVHPAKDHTEIWMANTRTGRLVKLEPLD
jgi:streptogramin lyase